MIDAKLLDKWHIKYALFCRYETLMSYL